VPTIGKLPLYAGSRATICITPVVVAVLLVVVSSFLHPAVDKRIPAKRMNDAQWKNNFIFFIGLSFLN
jgi:uncharacterized membrane protein YkvI